MSIPPHRMGHPYPYHPQAYGIRPQPALMIRQPLLIRPGMVYPPGHPAHNPSQHSNAAVIVKKPVAVSSPATVYVGRIPESAVLSSADALPDALPDAVLSSAD